jgi:hypothetical protein
VLLQDLLAELVEDLLVLLSPAAVPAGWQSAARLAYDRWSMAINAWTAHPPNTN